MELISIGFMLGVVFSMIVMGTGVVIGSRKKDIELDIKNNSETWLITEDVVQYSPDGGKNWVMSMDTQGHGIVNRETNENDR